MSENEKTHNIVRAGRRRDPGYVKVYRELLRCYTPLIGIDGIGYWTFLADYRHDGSRANELFDRAWVGRRRIMRETPIGSHHTVRRLNEKLANAGLLDIDRAGDLFTDEQLAVFRQRGVYLQPDYYVFTVHEPATFDQFCELNFNGPCRKCSHSDKCDAHAMRRNALLTTGPGAETAPPPPPGAKSAPGGGAKSAPGVGQKVPHNKNNKREQFNNNNTGVVLLEDCGVNKKKAEELVERHGDDYIENQTTWVKWRHSRGKIRDLAAYLVTAIERGYQPPADYLAAQEAEKRHKADEERWARMRELERQTLETLKAKEENANDDN